MNINDFRQPPLPHPYGMLEGYSHACEKETVLRVILEECIEKDDLDATVEMRFSHPTMVTDGLLEEVGEKQYKLTKKAIGLLYSQFFKEEQ
jgi:hypothetical protein